MTCIKSMALNAVCFVLALGVLGFFASIGLFVVGLVLFGGFASLIVMRLSDWFGRGDSTVLAEKATS